MSNIKTHLKEYLTLITFFTIFLIVYYFLNLFVLSQFAKLLNIPMSTGFHIVLFILTISYIFAASLESYADNYFFRQLYTLASVWMGMLFISFIILLIYKLLNLIIPITMPITGIIILIIVIVVTIYGIINAYTLRIKEITVSTKKDVELKIVQISDLHLGAITKDKYLIKIIAKINNIKPDIVLITGDMIDGRYKYDINTFKLLNKINAEIYFSSGNHEEYAGIDMVKGLLKHTKIKWLRNELIRTKNINIIGLDDTRNKNNIREMLARITTKHNYKTNKKFTILMNHRPIGWKDASKYVDMMISGHTHGGQIWPFIYLTVLEGNAIRNKYITTEDHSFMLYVTSGVGTWGPPIRIGSNAEIVVYNIKKGKPQ